MAAIIREQAGVRMQRDCIQIPVFASFLALGIFFIVQMLSMPLAAQNLPAPNAQGLDPKMTAAQAAFEALPDAERKTIQFDLVWAGNFTGANGGSFGPLTFRAINAFKSKSGAVTDGILSAADRKALAAAAKSARDAVAFQTLADARTGARIGIPQLILPKKDVTPSGGSRWQSADARITLDTRAGRKGDTLPALFEKATTASPTPGRRVTYKLLRPDFYVVSGETAGGKFYSRMASGPDGLRGFSIGYDKALAEIVEPLVIAIANSFEPFPSGVGAFAAAPDSLPRIPASPLGSVISPLAEIVPGRPKERNFLGLLIANGLVLTAKAAITDCKALNAEPRTASLKLADEASGLVVLEVAGLQLASQPKLAVAQLSSADAVVIMAFDVSAASKPSAVALPGHVDEGTASTITAPLQIGGAGAVAYDRFGGVAAIATTSPSERYLVAGVIPQQRHSFAGRAAIAALLQKAGVNLVPAPSDRPLTTGAIAQTATSQIVSLTCAP